MKKLISKIRKSNKVIFEFITKTIKNFNFMKIKIKKIWYVVIPICMTSCGTTQVSVQKPAEGTQTTISVTTNNPIKTDFDPTINMKGEKK